MLQEIVELINVYFSDDTNFITCQIEEDSIKLYFDDINFYEEQGADKSYPKDELSHIVNKYWHGEFHIMFGDGDTMVIDFSAIRI